MTTDQIGGMGNVDLTERANGYVAATAAGWVDVMPQGSWVNMGSLSGCEQLNTLGFKKDDDGVVRLKGAVRGGHNLIMTLPEGYRPSTRLAGVFAGTGSGSQIWILLNANGNVSVFNTSDWVSLDGISFPAR